MSKPRRKVIKNSMWKIWVKDSETAEQVVEILIKGEHNVK